MNKGTLIKSGTLPHNPFCQSIFPSICSIPSIRMGRKGTYGIWEEKGYKKKDMGMKENRENRACENIGRKGL